MNQYETLVPVELRNYVEAMATVARENLERDGHLTPVAFVGTLDGHGTMLGGLSTLNKDRAAREIARFAKQLDADFILHIDEAWIATTTSEADVEKLRAQYGEVQHIPGRIDAVMFQLETRIGFFLGYPTREPKGETFTFGPIKMEFMKGGHGRFVGLLPQKTKGH
jgi:hypothetical protein